MATALGKHPYHFVHYCDSFRNNMFSQKNKSFRQEYQASGKGATYCMKTSGEDKLRDLVDLNILIIGETGFPHPDIFTHQG